MKKPDKQQLTDKGLEYVKTLCLTIGERPVGSEGNRKASAYIKEQLLNLGWETETPSFDAIDWEEKGARLQCGNETFSVLVSPYSIGFMGEAELVSAGTTGELETLQARGKIILLHGQLAAEQLMPKSFVFFNPDSHRRIISALENSGARALICATGRNPSLSGGVYPFPLIEDGDFDIPSVYMTEEEGERLRSFTGKMVFLESRSERIPGKACNVIARKGDPGAKRVVVTAHLDAKKGTPGAIDNATGVAVLILLADLLKDYKGSQLIELVAFNGEDYYSVPGQMNYISANMHKFDSILLNINIDGAGFYEGFTSISLYDLPAEIENSVMMTVKSLEFFSTGPQWPQGDHSIFTQAGVPAIAITSSWFSENINDQDITHTQKDNISIVNAERLAEISIALASLISNLEVTDKIHPLT
jgi:aminopeptidase YwaD